MSKQDNKGNSNEASNGQQYDKESAKGFWQVVTSDTGQVVILVIYYMILLVISYWSIFDIFSGRLTVLTRLGVNLENVEDPLLLRTIGYTIIGGFLGSLLYNIRQLFNHYCGRTYNSRWFGKYITGPWEGGALAMIVLAMIRGGVAVFGGSPGTDIEPVTSFAAFSTGALVGFGMRDVVGWINGKKVAKSKKNKR
jgi:hypothetical protein